MTSLHHLIITRRVQSSHPIPSITVAIPLTLSRDASLGAPAALGMTGWRSLVRSIKLATVARVVDAPARPLFRRMHNIPALVEVLSKAV